MMFLQMMIPHHAQALALVRLAPDRAVRRQVRMLAAAIESTQAAEVETMLGWLRERGHPTTADPGAHAAHGGMPETSAAELAALEVLSGAAFEREFVNLLIAHQDDAIQLARLELATGTDPAARDLAERIVRSRSAQLTQLLGYATPAPAKR